MSDRRKALLGRFRAAALERLRRITAVLAELEDGRAGPAEAESVVRDLHTIKGESRMLGLALLSDLLHRGESLLLEGQGGPPSAATFARLAAALDVVARSLREEFPSQAAEAQALTQARLLLDEPVAAPRRRSKAPPKQPPAPAPALPEHSAEASGAAPEAAERWTQVSAAQLDQLGDLIAQFSADFRAMHARVRTLGQGPLAGAAEARALIEDVDRCRAQLDHLGAASWAVRLVPIEPQLADLLRHARELARAQGKRLRAVVEAAGVRLERSVLDQLWEPLLHLVRNAVDHGIEAVGERGDKPAEATLSLRAEAAGASAVITVADDGRGVDASAVRAAAVRRGLVSLEAAESIDEQAVVDLLFQHGFSTREQVGELSGRGVGLDVVRATVERVGGSVVLQSRSGEGTLVRMTIPTRMSQERALVIACGEGLYGIPSRHVLEVARRREYPEEPVAGGAVLRHRDGALPFRSLAETIIRQRVDEPLVVVLGVGSSRVAFSVPAVLGEHDLVRQPVDELLGALAYINASATLDDGRLVLLLTMPGLLRHAERSAGGPLGEPRRIERPTRVLVVDDSEIVRDLVAQVLRGGGMEVETAPEGRTALERLAAALPDVVVADIEMPVMDGFELLRRIRAQWRALPVVLLTSKASPEDRRRAVELEASAHLIKSGFEEATLVDTVQRLGRRR